MISRNKKILLRLSAFICLSLLFIPAGCSNNSRIPEKKLVKIYSDLVISFDTTVEKVNADSLRQKVFSKYGVTDDDYKKSIEWYNQNPKEWNAFFNKAIAYVDSLRKQKK